MNEYLRLNKGDMSNHQQNRSMLLLAITCLGHSVKHIYNAGFFIIIPELKQTLQLTNTGVGTITMARNISGGIANFPLGFLSDRFSRQFVTILAVGMVLVGVTHFLFGFAVSYWQAFVMASISHMAIASWHPAAIGALSRTFTERRGFAISIHGIGASIGETVGPILIGTLLTLMVWQSILRWGLIPAILTSVLVYLSLRSVYIESQELTVRGYLKAFTDLFRNKKLLLVLVFTGGYASAQSVMLTFLPIYVRYDLGQSSMVLGTYLTLAQGVGIFSQPVMGFISDQFSRKVVIVPSLLLMGILYIMLFIVASGPGFVAVIIATGLVNFSLMAICLAACADVVDSKLHGTTISLGFSSFVIFAGIFPLIAGFLADATEVRSVFLFAGSLALISSLFAFVVSWEKADKST